MMEFPSTAKPTTSLSVEKPFVEAEVSTVHVFPPSLDTTSPSAVPAYTSLVPRVDPLEPEVPPIRVAGEFPIPHEDKIKARTVTILKPEAKSSSYVFHD